MRGVMRRSRREIFFWWFFAGAWFLAIGLGFRGLMIYATSPGETGVRSNRWPSKSLIPFDLHRPNLILFLHPRCPCSMASLAELERILAASGNRVAVHVLVFRPGRATKDWERTGLWYRAAAIPGVRVWTDERGVEAKLFGAATSGLVVIYGASGKLVFQGGITPGRGHQGDNEGSTAVKGLIAGSRISEVSTPIFGCSLLGDQRKRETGNER